jgi:Protein of unknown function (DUF2934)
MPTQITKPAKKRTTAPAARKAKPRRRTPKHEQIAERAYFIHLEEGVHDQVQNWLRAERELTAA